MRYLFALLISLVLIARQAPEASGENAVRLSLRQAVELALRNNLDISSEKITPRIWDMNIAFERAKFDPSLVLGGLKTRSETPSRSQLEGVPTSISETLSGEAGISGKLMTGGSYHIGFSSSRSESNIQYITINPSYRSGLNFSLTHHLLKGFGWNINRAGIKIAENTKRSYSVGFKGKVMDVVYDVESAYWDLVYSIENLKAREVSLEQAKELLELTKALVRAGKLVSTEILRAEAGVASREEDVIIARGAVKDAEDRLKMVTNMVADPDTWDLEVIPTDRPTFEPVEGFDVSRAVEVALENRPDFLQAEIALENNDISLRSLRNSLLPSLDLTASYSLSGLGPSYDRGIDQLSSRDYNSWSFNISIGMPIGNRSARSLYEKAKLERKRSLLNLEKLKQSIAMEVRRAVRSIDTNSKRVQATKIALELEKQRLKAEEERFRLGVSTSNDVLQAQRDLATAKTNYLKAIVDYRKSLTNLERVKGTLLDSLGIRL